MESKGAKRSKKMGRPTCNAALLFAAHEQVSTGCPANAPPWACGGRGGAGRAPRSVPDREGRPDVCGDTRRQPFGARWLSCLAGEEARPSDPDRERSMNLAKRTHGAPPGTGPVHLRRDADSAAPGLRVAGGGPARLRLLGSGQPGGTPRLDAEFWPISTASATARRSPIPVRTDVRRRNLGLTGSRCISRSRRRGNSTGRLHLR